VVKTIASTIGIAALMCSAFALTLSKDDEVARDAAVQWLQLVDAGRNDEAASQASAEVRSFEQWQKYFADHRASLGRVNNRQFVEIRRTAIISGVPEVRRYYVVRFRTAFERKPVAIENITIAKIGCCWEIFGYSITAVTSDQFRPNEFILPKRIADSSQRLNSAVWRDSTSQRSTPATECEASEKRCHVFQAPQ
jgi:hypothetical protein